MQQQSFLHKSWIVIENRSLWRRDFHEPIGYRLRGVWRYAQDTVPIRACLFIIINTLCVLCGVSPSVTTCQNLKKYNKNNASAIHG